MVIDLIVGGILIGTVTRGGPRIVYARTADGEPFGTFSDIDAAAMALAARLDRMAAHGVASAA